MENKESNNTIDHIHCKSCGKAITDPYNYWKVGQDRHWFEYGMKIPLKLYKAGYCLNCVVEAGLKLLGEQII